MRNLLFTVPCVLLAAGSAQAATVVTQFAATLSNTAVVKGGVAGTTSLGTGTATFTLSEPDVGSPTLSYNILLDAPASLDGMGGLANNVTAIHLHDTNVCVAGTCVAGDTSGTKHTLNIFGVPRADDADMIFNASTGVVSGLWDASDENSLSPAPSGKPSDFLSQLFAGEMFLMIHTQAVPLGAYGGFITQVPEPTSVSLLFSIAVCMTGAGRRRAR